MRARPRDICAPSALRHVSAPTPRIAARSSSPERPEQRLDDLHAAFADPETSIVACVRGGYGSNYLLSGLDLELIRTHPKPFFAYSDLTGIQLRLLDQLGLPAFHGPMVAADFCARRRRPPAQLSSRTGRRTIRARRLPKACAH